MGCPAHCAGFDPSTNAKASTITGTCGSLHQCLGPWTCLDAFPFGVLEPSVLVLIGTHGGGPGGSLEGVFVVVVVAVVVFHMVVVGGPGGLLSSVHLPASCQDCRSCGLARQGVEGRECSGPPEGVAWFSLQGLCPPPKGGGLRSSVSLSLFVFTGLVSVTVTVKFVSLCPGPIKACHFQAVVSISPCPPAADLIILWTIFMPNFKSFETLVKFDL